MKIYEFNENGLCLNPNTIKNGIFSIMTCETEKGWAYGCSFESPSGCGAIHPVGKYKPYMSSEKEAIEGAFRSLSEMTSSHPNIYKELQQFRREYEFESRQLNLFDI